MLNRGTQYGVTHYCPKNAPQKNVLRLIEKNVRNFPAGIYLFKVNNQKTRTICEICLMWQ